MIQQEDIDTVKDLNLPQPVAIRTLKVGEFFSFVPNPNVFYKILRMDEVTGEVFARAISGIYKDHELSFAPTTLAWHWTKKDKQ